MMFDLSQDEGEVTNIAIQNPKQHKVLFEEMMRYFKEVGARLPKSNPNYDAASYQQMKEYKMRKAWGPFEGSRELGSDEILKE